MRIGVASRAPAEGPARAWLTIRVYWATAWLVALVADCAEASRGARPDRRPDGFWATVGVAVDS
jgi:hypothetical protein